MSRRAMEGNIFIVSPGLIEMMMCNGGLRWGLSVIFTPSQDRLTVRAGVTHSPLSPAQCGEEVIIVYNAVLKWVRDLNIGWCLTRPLTPGPHLGTEEAETGWKLGVVIPPLLSPSPQHRAQSHHNAPNCARAQAPGNTKQQMSRPNPHPEHGKWDKQVAVIRCLSIWDLGTRGDEKWHHKKVSKVTWYIICQRIF